MYKDKEGNNKEERYEYLFLLLFFRNVVPQMKLDWDALEKSQMWNEKGNDDNNKDENKAMYILQKNN